MNVLIVGGGISGISAAKVALKDNHKVTILELGDEPGGLMARIANCRVGFKTFYDEIRDDPRLTVVPNARITAVQKKGGIFVVALEAGQSFAAEKVIIATGLSPYDAEGIKGKRVLTSLEYDAIIDQRRGELPEDFSRVAFVLCVGSRSREYPLCSSVCCSYTLREIKWTLQRANPEITVFYNDLRFFGQEFFMEKLFRQGGISFVRANSRYFEEDERGVTVRYFSGGKLNEERYNYVVLAIALRPNPMLDSLSRLFGFSLNEHGFVREVAPCQTDGEGVYVCGGALEPMNIKDSILTGFGAAMAACKKPEYLAQATEGEARLYREAEPSTPGVEETFDSYLFYLGSEDAGKKMFLEYVSARFLSEARSLRKASKTVYIVTRNMVTPSYGELDYERARREGVIFIHLEEGESFGYEKGEARVAGPGRDLRLSVQKVVLFDDYTEGLEEKEFLVQYRSEPQLRWSPTKWARNRYHAGYIRFPRAAGRWETRETLGALGEMLLDAAEERLLPQVNEERCSGCGSCKDACPQSAIEMALQERPIAVFGPETVSTVPVAHVREDLCAGCGLCASTCPSDVISLPENTARNGA